MLIKLFYVDATTNQPLKKHMNVVNGMYIPDIDELDIKLEYNSNGVAYMYAYCSDNTNTAKPYIERYDLHMWCSDMEQIFNEKKKEKIKALDSYYTDKITSITKSGGYFLVDDATNCVNLTIEQAESVAPTLVQYYNEEVQPIGDETFEDFVTRVLTNNEKRNNAANIVQVIYQQKINDLKALVFKQDTANDAVNSVIEVQDFNIFE